eukprot:1234550-Amphidinium_carterae.1
MEVPLEVPVLEWKPCFCPRVRTLTLPCIAVALAMSARVMRGTRLKRGSSAKRQPEPKRTRVPTGAAPCALCGKTSQDIMALSAGLYIDVLLRLVTHPLKFLLWLVKSEACAQLSGESWWFTSLLLA